MASAVKASPEGLMRPGHAGSSIVLAYGRSTQILHRAQFLLLGEVDRLLPRDVEHSPSDGHRPMAERHDQDAARPHQRGNVWHRLPPLIPAQSECLSEMGLR